MTEELSSLPVVVPASQEEVSEGKPTWKNLEIAVRALHRHGLVILENLVDKSEPDQLKEKMVPDALTCSRKEKTCPTTTPKDKCPAWNQTKY